MTDNLNYEFNEFNKKNDVVTNQNLEFNKNKHILKLLKDNSEYVDDIYNILDERKQTTTKNRTKVTRINIDSSHRNEVPKNILTKNINLDKNCLSLKNDTNILVVKNTSTRHGLNIGDRIILQNVTSTIANLRGGLIFSNNSKYVKIMHPKHKIKRSDVENNRFLVKVSNVTGVNNNNTAFGNISLSLLNKTHIVYLTSDLDKIGSDDYYYIKISSSPDLSSITNENTFIDTSSNTKIEYVTIGGINLNQINSNYPINIHQVNGFLTVESVESEFNFSLLLTEKASSDVDNFGGSKMFFSKIKSFIQAYTRPNHYTIFLNKNLENVTKVKMISSEFPNTEKVIKNSPDEEINNKLYFQVLEDGDFVYSINVTSGNYSLNGLANEITSQITQLTRKNYTDSLLISKQNNAVLEKSDSFSAITEFNQFTDVFTISIFSVVIVKQPITVSGEEFEDLRKRIKVNHVNHGLNVGDTIRLENCVTTSKIPSIILNSQHIIESILDNNNYIIKLPRHNASSTDNDTGGGEAVNILIPLQFRLLFNYNDTIGNIIGFRNVGEENSITKFATTITNDMPYELDYFKDSVGNDIFYDEENNKIKNNVVQLFGHNYIIMKCNIYESNESLSTNEISNGFAKILLTDAPGSILFNQHIQLAEDLEKPVKTLSELEFTFLSPNGNLYEFNGLDHSFTLEFHEELTKFKGSNINVKTGLASEFLESEFQEKQIEMLNNSKNIN